MFFFKDKNQLVEGVNFKPMTAKDVACDLVGRTLIIAIFISICNILCLITISPVSNLINVFSQALLFAFYCFEYKTASAGIDTPTGLRLFESQWIYFMGFGFPAALVLYLTNYLGSSIFFLIFPLLVVISLDECGFGLKLVNNQRKTNINLHLFSISMKIKDVILDKVLGIIVHPSKK